MSLLPPPLHLSVRSSFLFLFLGRSLFPAPIIYPRYSSLLASHAISLRLHAIPACLSLVYGLLFANSAPTIDASRLIANPSSVYPPYLFPLTRAVNEIHAEDINRHSLRSRWVSRRPETRVRKYVLRDAVGQERAVFSNRTSSRLNYRHVIPLTR